MSLAFTLRTVKPFGGSFTYLQWLVIIIIFIAAIYAISWWIGELTKPPPDRYMGHGEGVFHGGRNFFCAGCTSDELKARNCYEDSMMYFWGNLTYNDTPSKNFEEGTEIRGTICLITVDSYVWSSNDLRPRTPITFTFEKATISPIPILDPVPFIPWFIIGVLVIIIVFLVRRKLRAPDFTAMDAEKIFAAFVKAEGIRPIRPMESLQKEVMAGREFAVAQLIEGQSAPEYLIMTIDNRKGVRSKHFDNTGDIYRATMSREPLLFNQEMQKSKGRYSGEQAVDMANKMLGDYMEEKQAKKLSKEEKEKKAKYLARKQQMMEAEFYPNLDDEEGG